MKIKNWEKFQHFKDRKPPWVKLYREILDDMDWHELDASAAKVLVMLWLIASEDDGNLPDIKKLSFRLRMPENKISDCISKLSQWLEQDDITMISTRYHDDSLETETETEKETKKEGEGETESARKNRGARMQEVLNLPDWLPEDSWNALVEHRKSTKSAMTAQAKRLAISKLDELRRQGNGPVEVINQTIINGWKGLFPIRDNQLQQTEFKRRSIHDERADTIAELTGRKRSDSSGHVIDITDLGYEIGD